MIERPLKECERRTHMSSYSVSFLSQAEEGGVLGTLPSFMSWLQKDSLRKPRIVIAICDLLNVHCTYELHGDTSGRTKPPVDIDLKGAF